MGRQSLSVTKRNKASAGHQGPALAGRGSPAGPHRLPPAPGPHRPPAGHSGHHHGSGSAIRKKPSHHQPRASATASAAAHAQQLAARSLRKVPLPVPLANDTGHASQASPRATQQPKGGARGGTTRPRIRHPITRRDPKTGTHRGRLSEVLSECAGGGGGECARCCRGVQQVWR